ncbi:phosphoribosylformylglycinamidine cyclo-ligase [bacterium]|nr:phosphoribosylformylglycinamidine cyclo-ligase [bacterium]
MDYQSSGVNIDEGNRAVENIKKVVKSTHSAQVLANIGGFAAGFQFPKDDYKEPILVSATDGVGTKIRLAIDYNGLDTVGIDCVAMCVNDLICMGAKPLFFLDYIACHKVETDIIKQVVSGIADGCNQAHCSLIGGETAEMNDMYQPGDLDIAGFCVGVVEKEKAIDGKAIQEGDTIYALPASGCHSNGYSLIRKVINDTNVLSQLNVSDLLTPTKIYVDDVNQLLSSYKINGIANITGGGLQENVNRVLPKGLAAIIKKSNINVLPVFNQIQKYGDITEEEMYRVFNMGVGMVVISEEPIDACAAYKIGTIQKGNQEVVYV